MPSPAKPLGLPGVGFSSPAQPRFAPPPQPVERVQPPATFQEWKWLPSVRFVGILLGLATLVTVGVWLYETTPSISLRDLWPSQSSSRTPASAEPIADAHPRALPPTPRGLGGVPNSRNEASPTARGTQREVLTVIAAPPSTAVNANGITQAPTPGTVIPPRGSALSSNNASAVPEPGSAVAFIASSHIYSALDDDVTPPETVHPQKLGNLKTGTMTADDRVTIEVVVNDQGFVEAAWGRTSPRTVGESLLLATSLHAVKSWAFRPARKDGNPVAYRKLITFQGY